MERQIILSSSELAFVSVILASVVAFFSLFLGPRLSHYFHRLKTRTSGSASEKIIFFFAVSLSVIAGIALTTALKFGHTEKTEWLTYELSSLVFFLTAFTITKSDFVLTDKFKKLSLAFCYFILLTQIIFLAFYSKWTGLFFLSGLILSSYFFLQKSAQFLRSMLFSLSGIFCVIGFFILNINTFSLPQILLIIFLWIAFSLSLIFGNKIKVPQTISTLILLIFWALLLFLEFAPASQKMIDYHHFSFYLGPVYEANLGKSIMSDIPSQYGYLSIYFINFGLKLLNQGISFESFHLFHTILLGLYFSGFYFLYKYLFKNNFLVFLFTAITIFLQTILQQFGGLNLPPSTAAMRFMFGLLVLLSLWFLPHRNLKFFFASLWAAIATFWSIETAVYLVPAFAFLLAIDSYLQTGFTQKSFISFSKRFGLYAVLSFLLWLGIVIKEYPYHYTLPDFANLLQYANTYKDGFGSILIPLYGNHYLTIAILLLGLFYTFHLLNKLSQKSFTIFGFSKDKTYWLILGLSFLNVHNFAILSYYISRSAYTNILNIGPFFILEFAILFTYLKDQRGFLGKYFLPCTLFVVLFFYSCLVNIMNPKVGEDITPFMTKDLACYRALISTYGLRNDNVLVVSRHYDTLLILENSINNKLPLNPSLMTTLLPNFEEKYITPNLGNIPDGTILVDTGDMQVITDILNNYFYLEPLQSPDSLPQNTFHLFRLTHKK